MKFSAVERAGLPNHIRALASIFQNTTEMIRRGEVVAEAATVTGVAAYTISVAGLIANGYDRLQHKNPDNSAGIIKGGVAAGALAAGAYLMGGAIEKAGREIRRTQIHASAYNAYLDIEEQRGLHQANPQEI